MVVTKDLSQSQINKFVKIITQDYPNFDIKSSKLLKGGWDNFVLEINKTYIFRFPKKKDFKLDKEIEVLKALSGKISLSIPIYEFIGSKTPYVGYKKIIGQALIKKTLKNLSPKKRNILARDIAKFFFEFHSALPISKSKRFNLEDGGQGWRSLVIKKKVIGKLKNKELSDFIEENLNKYLIFKNNKNNLVTAYNDLHGNNMAFDKKGGKLNGIFDFSDVAIEDIHREFCSLFSLDQKLALSVINYYEKLSGRIIDISRVFVISIINEASILGVFIDKPESKNYKYALNDLLQLKKINKI